MQKPRQFDVDKRTVYSVLFNVHLQKVSQLFFIAWCFSLSVISESKLSRIVNMDGKIAGQQ